MVLPHMRQTLINGSTLRGKVLPHSSSRQIFTKTEENLLAFADEKCAQPFYNFTVVVLFKACHLDDMVVVVMASEYQRQHR